MSIKVSSLVWDKWPSGGSEMLCILALSDWCNDEGGSLYPSIGALARKMRVSDRQAQRVLHQLINNGFVSVVGNQNGGAPGTTRQYHLNVSKIVQLPDYGKEVKTGDTDVTPDIETGDTGDGDGCHGCRETGDTDVTQTVIDPLEEPLVNQGDDKPKKSAGKRSTQLPENFEPNDTHQRLAKESGVDLASEVENFKDHHLAKGSTFKDWGRALNTWLRNAGKFNKRSNVHPFPNRSTPDPYANHGDCEGRIYIPGRPSDSDEWMARK